MKKIEAIIKPFKLDEVKDALNQTESPAAGITVPLSDPETTDMVDGVTRCSRCSQPRAKFRRRGR